MYWVKRISLSCFEVMQKMQQHENILFTVFVRIMTNEKM